MEGMDHLDRIGAMNHMVYGWTTPVASLLLACAGTALGLRCTRRALAAGGPARRGLLAVAATAFGSAIWAMHFTAMLGFGVTGVPVHYDVLLTVASLAVGVLVAGGAVALLDPGRAEPGSRGAAAAGAVLGAGVAGMHYTGMAAIRLPGTVTYDPRLVAASVAVGVTVSTCALYAGVLGRSAAARLGAPPLLALGVAAMHFLGMTAMRLHLHPAAGPVPGEPLIRFVLPLAVCVGSYLFLTAAYISLSPAGPRPGRKAAAA